MTIGGASPAEFIGRYAIRRLLGTGGFAAVFEAHDDALDAIVALKILDRQASSDSLMRERFLAEARLLRRVNDRHVVTVHDIGEADDGRPYFVMEFANGGVLHTRISASPDLVDARSLRQCVSEMAAGLTALHTAGIVHRDIKPENLLIVGAERPVGVTVTRTGLLDDLERVVLGDLGIAKDNQRVTEEPTILGGTPSFQAPEQMTRGAEISPATDVFGATGVLWNILTSSSPPEPDGLEMQLAVLPDVWRPVLRTGLDQDPAKRYQSANEWKIACLEALDTLNETRGVNGDTPVGFRSVDVQETCPYKGLAAFQPGDAALFFGREAMIADLVRRLQHANALVVGGPSGSGKSSLVRAGLLPALDRGLLPGSQHWRSAIFTPGGDALGELAFQASRLAGDPSIGADTIRDEPVQARRSLAADSPVVLVIDQFEELFTLNSEADQRSFVQALDELTAGSHSEIRVVIVVRADFYDSCAHFPWLAARINESQVLVGPMNRAELREAIEGPAHRVGMRLESGLVDQILDDSGDTAGSLPLVAHALMETWIRRRHNQLTMEGYLSAGGVVGAISQRAEETYAALSVVDKERARSLVLQMTNPGDLGPDTRRMVQWNELTDLDHTRRVVDTFVDARLVTTTDDHIEIAHETLLRSWPRAANWIDEARDDLRHRQRVEMAALEWEATNRDTDALLRGTPLESTVEWAETNGTTLTPLSNEFLSQSVSAREKRATELRKEFSRRRRNRRLAIGALAVLAVAAVVQWLSARASESTAQQQVNIALAATAEANAPTDPLFAVALAVESAAREDTVLPESLGALATARASLADQVGAPVPLSGPISVGDILHIDLSDDGQLLVLGSRDGDVVFWDVATRSEIQTTRAHSKGVEALRLDPSGDRLITGGADGQIFTWDLTTRPFERELFDTIVGWTVWNVDISPDGSTLAALSNDAGVTLYDLRTRQKRFDRINSAAARDGLRLIFTEDGSEVLVGNSKGELIRIDVNEGRPVETLTPHSQTVWEVERSHDGRYIYSAGNDGTIRRTDTETMQVDESFTMGMTGSLTEMRGLVALANGRDIIAGADDGSVWRWDIETQQRAASSGAAHRDEILDGDANADGTMYVSLGADQTIRLWDLDTRARPIATAAETSADGLRGLALGPDGSTAAGTAGGSVVVRRSDGSERTLDVGVGAVFGLEFTRSGSLVAGDDSGRLTIWNPNTGQELDRNDAVHSSRIVDVVLSPDGEEIAVGSTDGIISLWDAEQLTFLRIVGQAASGLNGLAFAGSGEVIAVGLADKIEFFDLDGSGPSRDDLIVGEEGLFGVAVGPDGNRIAVAGGSQSVVVFDRNSLEEVQRLTPLPNEGRDVAFLDESVVVGVSSNGSVAVWRIDTGAQLGPLAIVSDGPLQRLAVDENRGIWATANDGSLYRYDVLDVGVACTLTPDVLDAERQDAFLGGDAVSGCL